MKESATTRKPRRAARENMRAEYDFSNAVRGKYYEHYRESTNVVVLDADVAATFKNSEAVNNALRGLMRVAQESTRLTARPGGRGNKRRAA